MPRRNRLMEDRIPVMQMMAREDAAEELDRHYFGIGEAEIAQQINPYPRTTMAAHIRESEREARRVTRTHETPEPIMPSIVRGLVDTSPSTSNTEGNALTEGHFNDVIAEMDEVPYSHTRRTHGFNLTRAFFDEMAGTPTTSTSHSVSTTLTGEAANRLSRDARFVEDVRVKIKHHRGSKEEGGHREYWELIDMDQVNSPYMGWQARNNMHFDKTQMRQLRKIMGKLDLGDENAE